MYDLKTNCIYLIGVVGETTFFIRTVSREIQSYFVQKYTLNIPVRLLKKLLEFVIEYKTCSILIT